MSLIVSECTAMPGVQEWIRDTLGMDTSLLAVEALRRLGEGSRVYCLLGRGLEGVSALRPEESALQLGPEWVVNSEDARREVANKLARSSLQRPGMRVSSSLVFMSPTDDWIRSEPLVVSNGSQVWAVSSTGSSIDVVQQVLGLGEGYPPGVVAVHSGDPWAPADVLVMSLAGFDCETYFWWE